MTCDDVRDALMELALDELDTLETHLAECSQCSDLALRVQDADQRVGRAIDTFANHPGFDAAFARAVERADSMQTPVVHSNRWIWAAAASVVGLLAAAAGVVWFVQSLPTSLGLPGGDQVAAEAPITEPEPAAVSRTPEPDAGDQEPPMVPFELTPSRTPPFVELEAEAILGRLTPGDIALLQSFTYDEANPSSKRDAASRMLMVNAFSAAETTAWEAHIRYHLAHFPGDPDLHYKLALHLSKKGAELAEEVIENCERALEARAQWTGDTYTSRVYSLYKLRTAAGQKLWRRAENAMWDSPRSQVAAADATHWRQMTGVYAREWLEFARVAEKDTSTAHELCVTAKSPDYCGDP